MCSPPPSPMAPELMLMLMLMIITRGVISLIFPTLFLGWCGIPVVDIVDGFSPVGTVRRLSYRLRKKDGSRTRGVVNVAVKVEGSVFRTWRGVDSGGVRLPEMDLGRVAIGIPVKGLPVVGGLRSSRASSQMVLR
ncbi:hypothetical protein HanXRQr2_Chr06g0240141 [Helianthus annuus]|uniref:Uncharacterized protein n=1 Tax=Helianthus annuus TaxID=4232 RepID=A0A9K3IPJ1_HELAN|nr:hypothetical protein HanXRQr2_Chr06g0240141 [Helianthus annuus]KAJ0913828.1 hypothetical protein HanPSC8_Chr06g0231731 [Helianthus annuus]